MKIRVAQGSIIKVSDAEQYAAGDVFDIEESVGQSLVNGGSAELVIESRPMAPAPKKK